MWFSKGSLRVVLCYSMIINYTHEEYEKATNKDKLSLICEHCGGVFLKNKNSIKRVLNHQQHSEPCCKSCKESASSCKFCSVNCCVNSTKNRIETNCDNCGKTIYKEKELFAKNKRNFCSQECFRTSSPPVKLNCEHCGKEIYRLHSQYINNKQNFCSQECSNLHVSRVEVECHNCGKKLYKSPSRCNESNNFCSRECLYSSLSSSTVNVTLNCCQCGKEVVKSPYSIKRNKNNFCSMSCSAKYNSMHKTTICKRSLLEGWIENQLSQMYPELDLEFNNRKIMDDGLELDIFIPSLKLAFEINGYFHKYPVFGKKSFLKIKNKDYTKLYSCLIKGLKLVVVDSSEQTNFKPETSVGYLKIITDTIDARIVNGSLTYS